MNQLTEKTLANDAAINADICIIGSGPAGLTLAAELTACDLQVVVIESGKYAPDEEMQELNQFESSGKSLRAGMINRLRMVGGTSNLWPGRCMAFEPIDFHKREWLKTARLAAGFPGIRVIPLPGCATARIIIQRSTATPEYIF